MFQSFEWYTHGTATASHWKRLAQALPYLHAIGIDRIWLPPGCKAASPKGNGYDAYDLYDLGEFSQKGSIATKWGTKEELVELCQVAKRLGVGVIWDAVLNHKAAADGRERCQGVKVSEKGTFDLYSLSHAQVAILLMYTP
jgi:alpha-amylase